MIKAIRLQIIKPLDDSWKDVSALLRDLSRDTAFALNIAIERKYRKFLTDKEYHEKHKEWPDKEENKRYERETYALIREKFPDMGAKMVSTIQQEARSAWKKYQSERFYRRIPSYKSGQPILLSNQDFEIEREGKDFILSVRLTSKESGKVRYRFLLMSKTNSQRNILEKIYNGTYKKRGAKITFNQRKIKWFLMLPYDFEPVEKQLDPERVMGVDLGLSNYFYCAFNDILARHYEPGGVIEAFDRKISKIRKSIQQAGRDIYEVRKGRGRKKKLAPLKRLEDKVHDFRNTMNHTWARGVVNFAVKNQAGKIYLEDLSGIRDDIDNKKIDRWPFYDLQQKIEDKAGEYGIIVKKVDPKYSSQTCSECGSVDSRNRNGACFKCLKCGYEAHADYNAARNISRREPQAKTKSRKVRANIEN